jgi:hypothetical protein
MSRKSTKKSWDHMHYRCSNPSCENYADYGGRGITVDPRWSDFNAFVEDMGYKPSGLTLGRIDNDKGYNKENCRWETYAQQCLNQRARIDSYRGICGIRWLTRRKRWYVRGQIYRRRVTLYFGKDFFEACCARKSWEHHQKMQVYLSG